MTQINLLPWRAAARMQRQRKLSLLVSIWLALSLLWSGIWYWHNQNLIDYQQQRNDYLRQQIERSRQEVQTIQQLEKDRQALIARMQAISQLQNNRSRIVHLFDALADAVPPGIQLSELNQSGDIITLTGQAESNTDVSSFMRNIESNTRLSQPMLVLIEQNHFSLSLQQTGPLQ